MGIGKTLTDILSESGENANSLATRIGVPPSTIYSIINRDNMKVDIGLLARICEALDVSMEKFYAEYLQENASNRVQAIGGSSDTDRERLIGNYDSMTKNGRRSLVDYSDYLAERYQDKQIKVAARSGKFATADNDEMEERFRKMRPVDDLE